MATISALSPPQHPAAAPSCPAEEKSTLKRTPEARNPSRKIGRLISPAPVAIPPQPTVDDSHLSHRPKEAGLLPSLASSNLQDAQTQNSTNSTHTYIGQSLVGSPHSRFELRWHPISSPPFILPFDEVIEKAEKSGMIWPDSEAREGFINPNVLPSSPNALDVWHRTDGLQSLDYIPFLAHLNHAPLRSAPISIPFAPTHGPGIVGVAMTELLRGGRGIFDPEASIEGHIPLAFRPRLCGWKERDDREKEGYLVIEWPGLQRFVSRFQLAAACSSAERTFTHALLYFTLRDDTVTDNSKKVHTPASAHIPLIFDQLRLLEVVSFNARDFYVRVLVVGRPALFTGDYYPVTEPSRVLALPLMSGATASESTPLLNGHSDAGVKPSRRHWSVRRAWGWFDAYRRVLLATLLLSTTFWFTSTPLIYSMRVFACDEYYSTPGRPPYEGEGDACAIPAIEATTASDIGYMSILTTFSGMLNLMLTAWEIRHWGLRAALVQQTFWPALRNLCQTYATYVGGRTAITIIQVTQLITILGGGLGYNLAANSYITELVKAEERTASFGVLAGMNMLGTAIGYVGGGLVGSLVSLHAPFQVTFTLLVGSTIFTGTSLPYVAPTASTSGEDKEKEKKRSSIASILVFRPVKFTLPSGKTIWWYGLTLLAVGTFAGALATSYVPLMLQLTATNRYEYGTAENGYLMASLSLSRALFLTFAFPKIISLGRRWYSSPSSSSPTSSPSPAVVDVEAETTALLSPTTTELRTGALIPSSVEGGDAAAPLADEAAAHIAPKETDEKHGSHFDLVFLQWSILVDAVLTSLVAFASKSWHINLAAVILPLASGTAPACKGVLMDMIPNAESEGKADAGIVNGTEVNDADEEQVKKAAEARAAARRADALAGITIIETLAWIATVAIFGQLFAVLSALGKPNLVFFCNAGVALGAAVVLAGVRFPPNIAGRK
ncbi:hypothetical protein HMN09_00479900 [Mycena chlorophos]|uniref:MFS general substrate transporter n=1 Tax=Mycena chlorophos TaxID=658473 RepID=A0A8H6WH41_MYCCL|nr:hypothetical protein HMN09_00479900 [Mycena chlorophos]